MELSDKLKDLRLQKGVTQGDVAKLLGIERSTYGKYETGDSMPDIQKLLRLSVYYDVSTDYLLGKSNIKTPYNYINYISELLEDDEDLSVFWNNLKEREDLQLLFKQTRNLSPKTVKQVIGIIKAIEEEEDKDV